MRSPLLLLAQETPKTYALLLLLPLVTSKKWKVSLGSWRHYVLQKHGPDIPDLELLQMPPPWRLALMVPKGTLKSSQRRETTKSSTLLCCLWTTLTVWYSEGVHSRGSQNLMVMKRETVLCTRNLATTQCYWSHGYWREENQQPLIY